MCGIYWMIECFVIFFSSFLSDQLKNICYWISFFKVTMHLVFKYFFIIVFS